MAKEISICIKTTFFIVRLKDFEELIYGDNFNTLKFFYIQKVFVAGYYKIRLSGYGTFYEFIIFRVVFYDNKLFLGVYPARMGSYFSKEFFSFVQRNSLESVKYVFIFFTYLSRYKELISFMPKG